MLDAEVCGVVKVEEPSDDVDVVGVVEVVDDADVVGVVKVVDEAEVDGEGETTETEFEPKFAT